MAVKQEGNACLLPEIPGNEVAKADFRQRKSHGAPVQARSRQIGSSLSAPLLYSPHVMCAQLPDPSPRVAVGRALGRGRWSD